MLCINNGKKLLTFRVSVCLSVYTKFCALSCMWPVHQDIQVTAEACNMPPPSTPWFLPSMLWMKMHRSTSGAISHVFHLCGGGKALCKLLPSSYMCALLFSKLPVLMSEEEALRPILSRLPRSKDARGYFG